MEDRFGKYGDAGHRKMRKLISVFLQGLGLITVLSVVLAGLGLYLMGYWLVVNEEPAKADAIVVLGGNFSRPLHAADLYDKGYARVIYVGRPKPHEQTANLEKLGVHLVRHEERYKEILLKKRVPEKAISFFGNGHISTVEEAESLKKVLGDRPVRLLLVTSPYHTRRAKAIFGDVLPNAEIRMVATPYESFTQRWWTERDSAISVVLETAQTLFYHLGGAFRSTDTSPKELAPLHPAKN